MAARAAGHRLVQLCAATQERSESGAAGTLNGLVSYERGGVTEQTGRGEGGVRLTQGLPCLV